MCLRDIFVNVFVKGVRFYFFNVLRLGGVVSVDIVGKFFKYRLGKIDT